MGWKDTADIEIHEKWTDPETGTFYEAFTLNGKFHRTDGPARIFREPADGRVIEEWYQHGKHHRDDGGPAWMIKSWPHETIINLMYFKNGKPAGREPLNDPSPS